MVRGPAALLAACTGALALFLLAPVLPDLGAGDVALGVYGVTGVVALGLIGLAPLPLRDEPALLVLVGAGAGLIAAAMQVAGAEAAGNVPKALFAAALGVALGRWLATPVVLVAVPLFVAAIDVWSVAAGPTSRLLEGGGESVDFLTFAVPAWGGGIAGRLGVSDVVFLALFATFAWQLGLRRRVTAVALVAALPVAVVAELALDRTVPVLPLLAVALLAPNADLLPGLLRREDES